MTKAKKKKPLPKKKPQTETQVMDSIGRRFRVDTKILKTKLQIESNGVLNSIIEDGVRRFLLGEFMTQQMVAFLQETGVLTARSSYDEDVQLIYS